MAKKQESKQSAEKTTRKPKTESCKNTKTTSSATSAVPNRAKTEMKKK